MEQIRQLLDELEDGSESGSASIGDGFSAHELPLIIQDIVDDLQPLLTPYPAAFYWYLFRHSVAKNENAHLRVSTRRLQRGVFKSSYSKDAHKNVISLPKVRESLRALEDLGAIRKEGQANRDGTLYRVLIPTEIEVCRNYRAERTEVEPKSEISESEIDYYNIRENRIKVYERDEYKCRYCGNQLTLFTVTLDHVTPVSQGGDNSIGNLVTACLDCNSRKTSRPVGDFIAEQKR